VKNNRSCLGEEDSVCLFVEQLVPGLKKIVYVYLLHHR
jgi:hypothetical protein